MRDELLDDAGRDPPHALGLAAVVAERELVEIGLQMLGADRARVRAEQPALQQRDRPVAGLNGVVVAPLRLGLYDRVVRPLVQALLVVAGVAVRHDAGVGRDLSVGEAFQRGRVIVLDVGEAHPSARLRGDQNQLLVRAAFSPDERLVDLHERAERLAVGANHRGAQLMQPRPRRAVGAEAEDALEIFGGDAGAAGADLEDRAEPDSERLVRFLQQRAGGQARLMATFSALEQKAGALGPDPRAVASGAGGLAAPAGLDPVRAAVLLGRKPSLEFRRRPRKVPPQLVVLVLRHGPTPCKHLTSHDFAPELSA